MTDKNKKALEESVEAYIQHLRDKGHEDEDSNYSNDVFERAVEFVKGGDVWKELNALFVARDDSK